MAVQTWQSYLPKGPSRGAIWAFLRVNWQLGFIAFGGPPAHFKIFYDRFVGKEKWIDEQFFQELLSVSQALSGPASTKMLYSINLVHDGTLAAIAGFVMWSLPGAVAMFGLSLGVARIDQSLPGAVYALLSGVNAAVVGVIARATAELSAKEVTDDLTRLLVFLTASAGMLYNALWYFPLLMAASGLATLVHDFRWLHRPARALAHLLTFWRRRRRRRREEAAAAAAVELGVARDDEQYHHHQQQQQQQHQHRRHQHQQQASAPAPGGGGGAPAGAAEPRVIPPAVRIGVSWRTGVAVIAAFFASFVGVVVALRAALPSPPPRLYALFANMCLAGTVAFGGGPVVNPLLREYVVGEGWVSQRDFLIGLAVVQALPGPNFNLAVFLGSLAAANSSSSGYGGLAAAGNSTMTAAGNSTMAAAAGNGSGPTGLAAAGAAVAWLGIFAPGVALIHGTMGVWSALRGRRGVKAVLRGVNAGAVGLIYTAVYRIWQSGYVSAAAQQGGSLGEDPWWLVVAVTSFVFGRWYGVSPPVTIAAGAVMGLVWHGVAAK